MYESKERVEFSYGFIDQDDGTSHAVSCTKNKVCITADELCEMFVDFIQSAGYSENNVWDYFQNH